VAGELSTPVNIPANENSLGGKKISAWIALIFALKFWQFLREKFPSPYPSQGVHQIWNLSRARGALPPQKISGAPGPPTGEIRGVKFSTSPPPPSNSPRQKNWKFRLRVGLDPGYKPCKFDEILSKGTRDIFTFTCWANACISARKR